MRGWKRAAVQSLLCILAVFLRPWKRGQWSYPQTWALMPRNRRMRLGLEMLCSLLTGHERSETERSYGGGVFEERHCRWCDKLIYQRNLALARIGLESLGAHVEYHGWPEES